MAFQYSGPSLIQTSLTLVFINILRIMEYCSIENVHFTNPQLPQVMEGGCVGRKHFGMRDNTV